MSNNTLTTEQIAALAADMGVSVDEAQKILGMTRKEFKQLRDNAAFKVVITKAKNTKSKQGTSQVQLSFQALDENDQPVKGAYGTTWAPYPFNTPDYQYPDVDKLERALKDQMAILRAGGDAKFQAVGKIVNDGGKKRYFDAAGNELTPDQTNAAFVSVRAAALAELRARMNGEATGYVGTKLVAIHETREYEKDGETKVFKSFRLVPELGDNAKVPLITDPEQMFAESEG